MTATVALDPAGAAVKEVGFWLTVTAIATAFVALAAWFLVTATGAHHSTSVTPTVQQGGGASHNTQLCAPAPGTRYC
jgi:hypothetical protein